MSDFELKWNGDAFLFDAKKINEKAMSAAALTVERAAKQSFGKGASSLTGTLKRGSKRHRPSAPGFAPNIDTGILKSSVAINIETSQNEVSGFVGYDIGKIEGKLRESRRPIKNYRTAVEYGFFLEVGTRNMQPRPWLRPALVKSEQEILRIFRKANS